LAPLQAEANKILKQYRVENLLSLTYERQEHQHCRDRSERIEVRGRYQFHIQRNPAAINAAKRSHGWRLYVTNCPVDQFSLDDAVLTYRQAPKFERGFYRLKNRPFH
jgi:transposase